MSITEEIRAKRDEQAAKRRLYSNTDDPEVQRQREGTRGGPHMGRCWVLTEKGLALVKKWEKEGR